MATVIRSKNILTPQLNHTVEGSVRGNIILAAKFSFIAEGENELLIRKGDILKLLDRPGNGWVLVKFIDKVRLPGLVPALYIDIAVNDLQNPVTLPWLQAPDDDSVEDILSQQNYINVQTKGQTPSTVNNHTFPVLALISNFLLYNLRIWYRVDVANSDGSTLYVARYYHDFYQFHISLLSLQLVAQTASGSPTPLALLRLPKLPEPIPLRNLMEPETAEDTAQLLKRCNDLNVYVNKLLLNPAYQRSSTVTKWLDELYQGLPGFRVATDEAKPESNDEINDRVLPGSINVVKDYAPAAQSATNPPSESIPLRTDESAAPPQRTKLKNIYNHYQQAAQYSRPGYQAPSRLNSGNKAPARLNSGSNNAINRRPSYPDPTPPTMELRFQGAPPIPQNMPHLHHQRQAPQLPYQNGNESFPPPTSHSGSSSHFSKLSPNLSAGAYNPHASYNPYTGQGSTSHYGQSRPPGNYGSSTHGGSAPGFDGTQHQGPPHQFTPKGYSHQFNPNPGTSNPPHHTSVKLSINSGQYSSSQPNHLTHPATPNPQTRPNLQPYVHGRIQPRGSQSPANANGMVNKLKNMSVSLAGTTLTQLLLPLTLPTLLNPTMLQSLANHRHDYIKCKIVNGNDEIIAVKLEKLIIDLIATFKQLIKQKVYFVTLYIRLPNLQSFENIDRVNFNLTEFLRFNDKVMLKIG